MSSEPIITLRNVCKSYRAYAHPLHRLISRMSGGRYGRHREFLALNDISFDIHPGETVGIIGKNGSGKSTLLQIICGIRQATSGSIGVRGRIAALLELGSGFQADFTGRENVFLQGAIVGFTREEMASRFDSIAAFADIGEYMNQPVSTYSSGMTMRLAFAVAVSVDPDILVVDEALAVGDAAFQTKCIRHMKQMLGRGVTVIFVTHDINMAKSFCQRSIYLDRGWVRMEGESGAVCNQYLADLLSESGRSVPGTPPTGSSPMKRPGQGAVSITRVSLTDDRGNDPAELLYGENVRISIWYQSSIDLENLTVAFHVLDKSLLEILGTNTDIEARPTGRISKGNNYRTDFNFCNPLRSGSYSISFILAGHLEGERVFFDIWDEALHFRSCETSSTKRWALVGVPTKISHHQTANA